MLTSLSLPTTVHGRVLVRDVPDAPLVLVGFHGYFENADIQMDRLQAIPGADRWTLVAVQGLHRFYRGRSDDVVASWMTKQDRELMIADNIAYADRVIERIGRPQAALVMCGFSQGVGMAFRAAVRGARRADGVIGVGGDIPPDLREDRTASFPPILLARGVDDEWYSAAKLETDLSAMAARGVDVLARSYAAGHEWTSAVDALVADFCRGILEQGGSS